MSFRARSNDSVEDCKRADSIGSYLILVKFSDDGLGQSSPLECARCFVVVANDEGRFDFVIPTWRCLFDIGNLLNLRVSHDEAYSSRY